MAQEVAIEVSGVLPDEEALNQNSKFPNKTRQLQKEVRIKKGRANSPQALRYSSV